MKLALVGAGQRGSIYAQYAHAELGHRIVAVADMDPGKRETAARKFSIEPEMVFPDAESFFAAGKLADALILATMDRDHYSQTLRALELGYDILLEKPISPDPVECLRIQEAAHKYGRKIVVCHVLRYTNFFAAIKQILESGELGRVVTIQHAENVGNFHMAHSFVRGNWRNSNETSPIIMQKSCHDMDILVWLTDSDAKTVSSFGSRSFFRAENAPEGSGERCLSCPVADTCRFDVRKAYLPLMGEWPATVVTGDQTEAGLLNALQTSPYGRCVFRCDNNVCDHQVTIIEFKNGVNVSFTLSGFTNRMCRETKIMCEYGEINACDDGDRIEITRFNSNQVEQINKTLIRTAQVEGFHGGGDSLLMEDFISNLEGSSTESKTAIERSIESHVMACAAELSRVTGRVVDIDEFKAELQK